MMMNNNGKRKQKHLLDQWIHKLYNQDKKKAQKYVKTSLLQITCNDKTITQSTLDNIKQKIQEVYERRGYETARKFKNILTTYISRIGQNKFDIGKIPGIQYKIKLKKNYQPRFYQPIALKGKHREDAEEYINLLLKYGLISEVKEQHQYASPAFVVINGDKSTRLVCNYKHINEGTEDLAYPTPNVESILSSFNNKSLYSKIDIIKAFFNIEVEKESRKYTTIILPWGTYEWNVMPFGGKNAPATWAMASDRIFNNLKDVIKYVDDITVATDKQPTKEMEDEIHLQRIEELFKRLVKYNLKIKIKKCDFFVQKIEFLGNTITPEGRKPSDEYIKKILNFRRPRTIKELRGYLGAIEWISSHIYGLKKLMIPLRPLLKHSKAHGVKITKWNSMKFKLDWNDEHQKAFENIRNIITNCEILHHPDFNKEFYLYTDASDLYYSGVLLQKKDDKYVIIDMFSKMFNDNDIKRHITSKEILAIIESIKRWESYLTLNKFTIHTDANNIVHLLNKCNKSRTNNAMHYRWALLLTPLNFDIKHVKGIDNKIADFLSRIDAKEVIKQNGKGTQYIQHFMEDKRNKSNKRMRNYIYYNLRNRKKETFFDSYPKYEYKQSFIKSFKDQLGEVDKAGNFILANKLGEKNTNYTATLMKKLQHIDNNKHDLNVKNEYRHYNYVNKHHPDIHNPNYNIDKKTGNRRSKRIQKHNRNQRDNNLNDSEEIDNVINNDIGLRKEENDFRELSRITDEISKEINSRENVENNYDDDINKRDDDLLFNDDQQFNEEKKEDIPEDLTMNSVSNQDAGRSLANESDEQLINNVKMIIKQPIYVRDILKKKNKAKRKYFTDRHILHNQLTDPYLVIIRKVIKGEDSLNDIKDLPRKISGDLKKKLYQIDSTTNLIQYKHSSGWKTVLPHKHKTAIMKLYHDGILSGHSNHIAMGKQLINDGWYWCGYQKDMKQYVDSCEACVKARGIDKKDGKLCLWKSRSFNECVCIDCVGPIPVTASGNRYIINMVDRFTGYAVSVPTPSISGFQIVWTILNHWIATFGIPISILTDNGSEYDNEIVDDLCDILEINHKKIIPYMSPTNGTVERYNRTMTTTLRKLMVERKVRIDGNDNKICWDLFMSLIAAAHNNRISRKHNYSPNQLVFGMNLRLPKDTHFNETKLTRTDLYNKYIKGCRLMAELDARKKLDIYDEKRKEKYDEKHKQPTYLIGDLVLWWKGPYPMKGKDKYINHWKGPLRITDIWNNHNNVTLEDEASGEKFNVNVTRIKRYNEVAERQQLEQEQSDDDIEMESNIPDPAESVNNESGIDYDDTKEMELEPTKPMEHKQTPLDPTELILDSDKSDTATAELILPSTLQSQRNKSKVATTISCSNRMSMDQSSDVSLDKDTEYKSNFTEEDVQSANNTGNTMDNLPSLPEERQNRITLWLQRMFKWKKPMKRKRK